MPVRNILRSICEEKLSIPNPYQLRKRTGLAQGTCLRIWGEPDYLPDKGVMEKLCETLELQPGDFIIYEPLNKSQKGLN